jgi:hypothetical protein
MPFNNCEAVDKIADGHAFSGSDPDVGEVSFIRCRIEKDLESISERWITEVAQASGKLACLGK